MSFAGLSLGIWTYFALGAVGLAVGAYIIKMRRRRFEVPFVQLWKRVLEQKDANALWKQLKRLISLLLILLILALVLFAALDPTLGAVSRKARASPKPTSRPCASGRCGSSPCLGKPSNGTACAGFACGACRR